ncbi:flagellin lysine-N-methylase [Shewanella colwelliana]|uniref:flagellin lysine-N-methylase n=1 Tax=Shewanella colwelliana TaxID=23 RepID=UPI0037354911
MKNIVITPNYVNLFSCIGPKCEDSCCNDWGIYFDKKTYKKIAKHPDFSSLAKIAFKEIKTNNDSWAVIELDEQGACRFLNEKKLCKIHDKAGEDALSDTCKTYPKVSNHIAGNRYNSLSLSCPEVTRIVLFEPEAFQFDAQFSGNKSATPIPEWQEKSYDYSLELLVNLGLDWEESLLAIGLLIKTSDNVAKGIEPLSSLDIRLKQLQSFVQAGLLTEQYKQIPYTPSVQTSAFVSIHSKLCKIHSRANRPRFTRLNEAVNKICNEDNQYSVNSLNNAWHEIVLPSLGKSPDIFERYILYSIYHNHFPMLGKDGPLKAFRLLVLDCLIIRCYLSAIAYKYGELSESDIILCFQVYQVVRQHRSTFTDIIDEIMQDLDLKSIPAVISLLKTK